MIIEWEEMYQMGIDNVDEQHREMFRLLNYADEILKDVSSDNRHSRIMLVLYDLLKYSEYHFEAEETYMLKIGYPDYFKHKIEHTRLIGELKVKLLEFNSMYTSDISRILNYTSKWVTDHILEEDAKIVKFSDKNQAK